MKPEQYNSKAREAFARSLIAVSTNLFIGLILLITVSPLTAILSGIGSDGSSDISIGDLISFLTSPQYFVFVALLSLAFVLANFFRKEGLRHLHEVGEMENQDTHDFPG